MFCPNISQAWLLSVLLPTFCHFLSNWSLLFLLGVCKTLGSERAHLPVAGAPVFRLSPSRVDMPVAGFPKHPHTSGIEVPRLCLLVAPVFKPDWLCPRLPALPSIWALGQASALDAGEHLTAVPPAALVQLLCVAAAGLPWWEAHPYQKPGLLGSCPRVSSTDSPVRGDGWPVAEGSGCLAHPLSSRKEKREKGTAMENGRRGKWSYKEAEDRNLTPLPPSCGTPAGPHKALAGVPGPWGCPHQTHEEGPGGACMREATLPSWGRGLLGRQQDTCMFGIHLNLWLFIDSFDRKYREAT